MASYTGFSTIGIENKTRLTFQGKYGGTRDIANPAPITRKFTLTDYDLVIRDLINMFNIKQGEKVGNPGYGSVIHGFLFEPNDQQTVAELEDRIRKMIATDPRIILNTVLLTSSENGILVQLELAIQPFNKPINLRLFMDRSNGQTRAI